MQLPLLQPAPIHAATTVALPLNLMALNLRQAGQTRIQLSSQQWLQMLEVKVSAPWPTAGNLGSRLVHLTLVKHRTCCDTAVVLRPHHVQLRPAQTAAARRPWLAVPQSAQCRAQQCASAVMPAAGGGQPHHQHWTQPLGARVPWA